MLFFFNTQCIDYDDLDLFIHTDEMLLKRYGDMSKEEKFRVVYQEEVMRTVTDGL